MKRDPLSVRLFGYGLLYPVRVDSTGAVRLLPSSAKIEAESLARELTVLVGREALEAPLGVDDVWYLSMPFGRCGLNGLPREHLRLFHCREAYLDLLDAGGARTLPFTPGNTLVLEPGHVVRVRARAQSGRRPLVAFQTEDRTPLLGNAGAFILEEDLPEDPAARLEVCHRAFDQIVDLSRTDPVSCRDAVTGFFARMAEQVEANAEITALQQTAREAGTYDQEDQESLFARQQHLLSAEVIGRIRAGDPALFRYPGMFGAVASLFPLLAAQT